MFYLNLSLQAVSLATVLQLAFQSIGVVYGDIGISPLYVFASTFTDRIPNKEDITGALSLIIYSLTLFPLIKYVFIVLWANDNGDGGTFAMYSLICKHSKVSAIPAEKIKEALEKSTFAKTCLLSITLLGTCMVIGDGILTPCISVVVMISVAILVALFSIQRFGTEKVGYTFASSILIWYTFIGIIGISNLIRHDSTMLKAFNPYHIFLYFKRNHKQAWLSLGGVVLCITGSEVMFADLGHFSVRSIQIAFAGLVYPCLIFAYMGQAAYLSIFPYDVSHTFYKSTPEIIYWPMFAVAVLASIIASQAMISATFSIIKQSVALGCFPQVRIIHTSPKHEGQVYIPEINFLLMFACVMVTVSFKETTKIGNAYGIAVVAVMIISSSLLTLIMLMIWQTSLILIILFVIIFGSFELLYFSSVLFKFTEGGYLPLTFASILFFVMYVWHYVQTMRYNYEVDQKVSTQYLSSLGSNLIISRVPGVGLLYTELTQGLPAIFPHFLTNLPAIHSVLVFVSVTYLPVNKVPVDERFLLRRVGPKDYKMYRCIARYGYRDKRVGNEEFENLLMEHLKSYIAKEEIMFLETSRNAGVVYLLGHTEVRANEDSCLFRKIIIDYVYDFLRRNSRQGFVALQIPNRNLLQVGMNYYI
ncbi:Potassium transporter 5 [Acorus gramineus]|uniref:Potassium transporter n=1 Tax=Acorus gramineus TaxID=55184 RepID=A0AAV9B651_ACOGR|nr:Potassium transporter 5 [Acorus gramineus]